MINPKTKGKKGEDEACLWIAKHVFEGKRIINRNYNQTFVGCDIVSNPFIFEVKRCEILALDKWWIQISKIEKRLAEHKQNYIPVVMFRQNKKVWEFLISATVIGDSGGYIRLSASRFMSWSRRFVT